MLWTLSALIAATSIDIGPDDNLSLNINIDRDLSLAFQIPYASSRYHRSLVKIWIWNDCKALEKNLSSMSSRIMKPFTNLDSKELSSNISSSKFFLRRTVRGRQRTLNKLRTSNETYMRRETARILRPEAVQSHGIPVDELPRASRNFRFTLLNYK